MPLIAIVDDDEAVREALCDLLQVEGFAGETFDGAAAFLSGHVAGRFDCVITDVRMPGMDGLELQQRLRACDAGLPVIFLTSTTDALLQARALACGAIAWFTKPVADEALLGALRAALG
jgi:two-component system response regulator FixJ